MLIGALDAGQIQANAEDKWPMHGIPNGASVVMPKLGWEKVVGGCFQYEAIKCSKLVSPMVGGIVGEVSSPIGML